MVSFDCKKCNYSTKYKYDFNKHLKTKKHRVNEISIPKNENIMIRTSKNIHKTSTNIHKTSTNIQIFTLASIAKKHSLIFPINADMNYTDVRKILMYPTPLLQSRKHKSRNSKRRTKIK